MKNNKKRTGAKVVLGALCGLSLVMIATKVVCFGVLGKEFISAALSGMGTTYGDEESAKKGDLLVKKVEEDSVVLLKNENKCLPLNIKQNNKVNVFGYNATDNAWIFTGCGSGSCIPDPAKRIGILKGLENAGFEYNKEIIEKYEKAIPTSDPHLQYNRNGQIIQPANEFYTKELINNAKDFSDTAIVILSRCTGENQGEIPAVSKDYVTGEVDDTRTYLELSKKEEYMLNVVKDNFSKVIVILNTTNDMQCDFLADPKIDAALFCGPTGLSGTESVANLLAGQKTVKAEKAGEEDKIVKISPSGHLADTYARDFRSEPSYANAFVRNKSNTSGNIMYQEGIYFGYRWYETANAMGYFNGLENGYDSAVVYPFGYGLSYTTFDWKLKNVSLPKDSELALDSKINVVVEVTNTGEYPGKDVVELYYRTPYINGGIEKSYISLGDYAKTSALQPGESQEVTLSISAYDMASYDCYDKNNNGFMGYELDAGDYYLDLKTDVHNAKTMENGTIHYKSTSGLKFEKDPVTNYYVINRFTGDSAYGEISIDGSNVGVNEKYLSRENFIGTYRDTIAPLPTESYKITKSRTYVSGAQDQDEMPVFDAKNNLYLTKRTDGGIPTLEDLQSGKNLKMNDELVDQLMQSYDSPLWQQIVDQMSKAEVRSIVERSGFGCSAVESIAKPKTLDFDGPSGFNQNTQKIAEDNSSWTSYPPECVIACSFNKALAYEVGQSIAFEASRSGINGWYAPGVNLHRSNYNGRNFEYYSEDPVLSGEMAAATIKGAKSGGMYCYLKHFVVSEEGDNPKGVDTWLTEQTLREMYLKPFEIAVKAGANSIMTAFNRLGSIWVGGNYDLCTEVLRNEWGFKGSIVTDWCSGDETMNTRTGIIAGNDLWLNPMSYNGTPLSESNPTHMYCAKLGVIHNLYTYVSTYQYSRDYKDENNEYKVDSFIKAKQDVSEWWIWTLIGIDVVVFSATAAMALTFIIPGVKNKIAKKKELAA